MVVSANPGLIVLQSKAQKLIVIQGLARFEHTEVGTITSEASQIIESADDFRDWVLITKTR